jgi:ankyrin repeat protein
MVRTCFDHLKKEINHLLEIACEAGHHVVVSLLLSQGADVHYCGVVS